MEQGLPWPHTPCSESVHHAVFFSDDVLTFEVWLVSWVDQRSKEHSMESMSPAQGYRISCIVHSGPLSSCPTKLEPDILYTFPSFSSLMWGVIHMASKAMQVCVVWMPSVSIIFPGPATALWWPCHNLDHYTALTPESDEHWPVVIGSRVSAIQEPG